MTPMQIRAKIEQRRRQMLVNSIVYYSMDNNLISDATYDKWAKELQQLQADYPEISKLVPYMRKEFESFTDTTSGYDLPLHDKEARGIAARMIQLRGRYQPIEGAQCPKTILTMLSWSLTHLVL